MNSLKPYGRRIYVKPEAASTTIQTPDTSLVERATVIDVGPDVTTVQRGEKLLFTSFGVDSIDINGERHYFLLEDDNFILAKYVDEQ